MPDLTAHQADSGLRIQFTGSGWAYFRIWIVNLMLSIVTLGIYSAWAKVRRERYFLNNTLLDASPFEYHADPLSILRGRLLAVSAIVLLSLSAEISPLMNLLGTLIFLALLPWMISRSLRFRAHNTSWRGIRFGFDGGTGGAVKAWILWPVATLLSLGALLPFAIASRWRYVIDQLRFGQTGFSVDASAGPIYRLLLRAGLIFLALATAGLLVAFWLGYQAMAEHAGDAQAVKGVIGAAIAGGLVWLAISAALVAPYVRVRLANRLAASTMLEAHRFSSDQRPLEFFLLVFSNWLLTLLTLGLFRPFAAVRLWRYQVEHFVAEPGASLDDFVAAQTDDARALGSEAADLLDLEVAI